MQMAQMQPASRGLSAEMQAQMAQMAQMQQQIAQMQAQMERERAEKEAQMAEKGGELETTSKCCACERAWSKYEGKFVCGDQKCKVPVLVCDGCRNVIEANTKKNSFVKRQKKGSNGNTWNANKSKNDDKNDPHDVKNLRCPLCKVGKELRSIEPVDSAAQKRLLTLEGGNAKINASNKRPRKESKTLFIGKLPLSVLSLIHI